MTNFTITGFSTQNQFLDDGGFGFIADGATLLTTSAPADPTDTAENAIDGVGVNTLTVMGDLIAQSVSGSTAYSFEGARTQVLVGAEGSIVSTGAFAVLIRASSLVEVMNFGAISAPGHIAFYMDASDEISPSESPADLRLQNHGEITGSRGVFLSSGLGDIDILNTGLIAGDHMAIVLVTEDFQTSVLTNTGEIISANWAIDAFSRETSAMVLINSGEITAERAYLGGIGADLIENAGSIVGHVWLGSGDDRYDGGAGVIVGAVAGYHGHDVLIGGDSSERFHGGTGEDRLNGRGGDDVLSGGAGEDVIRGGDGDDDIYGCSYNNDLRGGDGDDQIYGGRHRDFARGGEGNDLLDGGDGEDDLRGDKGDDQLSGGDAFDTLRGGEGADMLDGGDGADNLRGDEGRDQLFGGAGADFLRGGDGQDVLSGGGFNDRIAGGRGDDELIGGRGADTFVIWRWNGDDVIRDFTHEADIIDLAAFGFRANLDVKAAALSNAGGGASFLDLAALGGAGSVLIEGLSFSDADASDFLL